MSFAPIPEILEEIRQGRMIILVDDEDRENEGDFCMAAEAITPDAINFMITHGRGLVCVPMDAESIERLRLHPQSPSNNTRMGTAFTVSVDARVGVTTGISSADRATTIRKLCDPDCQPDELSRPGHSFPLRAEPGGVLVRTGHTEGMVDLCRLAGMQPIGVVCEILNADGTMARAPDLAKIAQAHDIKMTSIADLVEYRRRNERMIEHILHVRMPTRHGDFDLHLYRSVVDRDPHIALTRGIAGPGATPLDKPVVVRVHSSCFTGDLLESLLCDCGSQLELALAQLGKEPLSVLLYMQQEGRGIGLENKLRAYKLQQEEGLDTVEANEALGFADDVRHYGIGAQILRDLGVRQIQLLTNNPRKYNAIKGYNLQIVGRLPLRVEANAENARYLRTKQTRMGHDLGIEGLEDGVQEGSDGGAAEKDSQ